MRASLDKKVRLYVSVATDEAKENTKNATAFTDVVRDELLRENNLRKVQYLSSILPFYKGMLLLLYSKKCVRLNLMNGCEVSLEDIMFAHSEDDDMPNYAAAGSPILLRYMPTCLLLRAIGAKWTLPSSMLPSFLDKDYDRTGLFVLYPETKYLKRNLPDGKLSLIHI